MWEDVPVAVKCSDILYAVSMMGELQLQYKTLFVLVNDVFQSLVPYITCFTNFALHHMCDDSLEDIEKGHSVTTKTNQTCVPFGSCDGYIIFGSRVTGTELYGDVMLICVDRPFVSVQVCGDLLVYNADHMRHRLEVYSSCGNLYRSNQQVQRIEGKPYCRAGVDDLVGGPVEIHVKDTLHDTTVCTAFHELPINNNEQPQAYTSPILTSMAPRHREPGVTNVHIRGYGLLGCSQIYFGPHLARVLCRSDTEMEVEIPELKMGTVQVGMHRPQPAHPETLIQWLTFTDTC